MTGPVVPRRAAVWAAVFVVMAVMPILIAGWAGMGRGWLPAGDWAVLELRTRDVGSALTPMIGPYSRFGWNHPGPLLFWLLAVPYRLSGASSGSLLFGAAVVNAAAVAMAALFAWRRGGLVLVAGLSALTAVLASTLGPSFLRDPWNPSVTVLALGLFVMLAWSAVEGDRAALVLAALVGSFLVQSHVGYALVVLAGAAWALGGFVWRRRAEQRPWHATVGLAALVGVACWLPVVVDQLRGTGNVSALVDYFTGATERGAGLVRSAGLAARQLGDVGPWQGGSEPVSPDDGSVVGASWRALLVPGVAFVGAAAVAWRRRAPDALRFQATVALAAAAGLVAVSRITGDVYNYLIRWWWPLAMLWWLSIGWSLWAGLVRDRPRVARPVLPAVLAVAMAVTAAFGVRTVQAVDRVGTPDGEWYVPLEAILPDTLAGVPRDGPVVVRATGSRDGSVADGVRLQLDREGIPVEVDDENVHKYGEARRTSTEATAVVWVVTGSAAGDFDRRGELRLVARWDPLDPAQREEADALAASLADQLAAVGREDLVEAMGTGGSLDPARGLDGIDQELLGQVETVRRRGDPVSVYVASPDHPG